MSDTRSLPMRRVLGGLDLERRRQLLSKGVSSGRMVVAGDTAYTVGFRKCSIAQSGARVVVIAFTTWGTIVELTCDRAHQKPQKLERYAHGVGGTVR